MARLVTAVLSVVSFAAIMEGFYFLADNGISTEFGVAFVFGVLLSLGLVVAVDRDTVPAWAAIAMLLLVIAAALQLGVYMARNPANPHFYLGALVGLGLMFPLAFWANGDDRRKRGNPRPPLFQRPPATFRRS